jgi:hypothetical protein
MMAKSEQTAERGFDDTMSAFVEFYPRHGIHVDDRRDAQLKLRVRDVERQLQVMNERERFGM